MKVDSLTVYIAGDGEFIEEFSRSFLAAGYRVIGAVNAHGKSRSLPKGIKKSATVPRTANLGVELSSDKVMKRRRLAMMERSLPPAAPVLSSSVLITAAEQATWLRRPGRLIGIGALPTLIAQRLVELAPTSHTDERFMAGAVEFLRKAGKEVSVVQDRVGMVMPRILCMLINEAAFALSEQIASPQDIDAAMKLGTNYPSGPIEWGSRIGFTNVLAVLDALYADLHEDRYRAAPLLRQLSML